MGNEFDAAAIAVEVFRMTLAIAKEIRYSFDTKKKKAEEWYMELLALSMMMMIRRKETQMYCDKINLGTETLAHNVRRTFRGSGSSYLKAHNAAH
uniref:Four helix bundle protein n=1 Tax=Syphacia muris TaxID=451379 RepID=A0A0N5AQI7_9BILA